MEYRSSGTQSESGTGSSRKLRERRSLPSRYSELAKSSIASAKSKPLRWHKGEKAALHSYLQQQLAKRESHPASVSDEPVNYVELQRRIPTRSQQEIKDFLEEVIKSREQKVKERHKLITVSSCVGARTVNEWYELCAMKTDKLRTEKETLHHKKAATVALANVFAENLVPPLASAQPESELHTDSYSYDFNPVIEYFKNCMEGKNNVAENPLSGFDALVALEILKDIEQEKPDQDLYIDHLAQMFSWFKDQNDSKDALTVHKVTRPFAGVDLSTTGNQYLNPMEIDISATFQPF